MRCLPNGFSFSKLFSSSSTNALPRASHTLSIREETNNSGPFRDAIYKHLDAIEPNQKTIKRKVAKVSQLINKRLKPQGVKTFLQVDDDQCILARATGIDSVFKHATSKEYVVRLPHNQQLLKRTRAEIETHILLQSHLKANDGDPSIRNQEVITLADIEKKHWLANLNPFSKRRKEMRGEHEPLLSAQTQSRSAQSTPRAHRIDIADLPEISSSVQVPVDVPVTHQTPPSQPQRTSAQQKIISEIKEKLDLSPLEFLDELSRENPEVASYFAVQTARLRQQVGPAIEVQEVVGMRRTGYAHSAVPGFLVRCPGHGEQYTGLEIQYQDKAKQSSAEAAAHGQPLLHTILLEMLEHEMDRQNLTVSRQPTAIRNTNTVFPLGIASALGTPQPSLPQSLDRSRQKDYPANLSHKVNSIDLSKPLSETLQGAELCAGNPEAVAFFGFIEQMMLCADSSSTKQIQRYTYVKDEYAAKEKALADKFETDQKAWANGEVVMDDTVWAQTFIHGVERNAFPDDDNPEVTWRVRDQGGWKHDMTTQEVAQHVFNRALSQLQNGDAGEYDIGPLPLAAYGLLAKATGLPIPQHLVDHEAAILQQTESNKTEELDRQQRNRDASDLRREQKAETARKNKLQNDEQGVANNEERFFCMNGLLPEKIAKPAADCTFHFEPGINALDKIRVMQEKIKETHQRLPISYKDAKSGASDNLCWMRSSWVPILACMTPENLAKQARDLMGGPKSAKTQNLPEKLESIARQYQENPAAFLHQPETLANAGAKSVAKPAYLGTTVPSSANTATSNSRKTGAPSTEGYLKDIQLAIATGFRFENPSLMREALNLSFPMNLSLGTSDLPIALHRALGESAMVIEMGSPTTDEDGKASTLSAQIRVTAPLGTPLANAVERAAADNKPLGDDEALLDYLLTSFAHRPIILLERGHFEVYMPIAKAA